MSAAVNRLFVNLNTFSAIVAGESESEAGICIHTAERALLDWISDLREGAIPYSDSSMTGCINGLDPDVYGVQTIVWVSPNGADIIRRQVHTSVYTAGGTYPFSAFWDSMRVSQSDCLHGRTELGQLGLTMLISVPHPDYESTLPPDAVTLVQITRNKSYLDPDVIRAEVSNPSVDPYG